MFELLALNPPARAGGKRIRGGKSRTKSRAGVRKSSRRRARRSSNVPKHRLPPRIKSGPNKGQFRKRKGARRRNPSNPTGRVFSGKFYRPKIRRRKSRKWAAKAFGIRGRQRRRIRSVARAYFNPPRKRRAPRRRKNKMTGYDGGAGTLAGWLAAKPARRKRRKAAKRAKLKKHLRQALRLANPRRRRRKARHSNPVRRRSRRYARRHRNPVRRHRSRRYRNPVAKVFGLSTMGPKVTIPFLKWEVAPVQIAFDGVGLAAGASAAALIPAKVAELAKKPWLNQGWYGVGASALTTAGLAGVGRLAGPRLAKLLALGGSLTTALRALAMFAPASVKQYVNQPIAQAAGGGAVISPAAMQQIINAATGKAGQAGMGRWLSADSIIAGESRGLNDWVTANNGSGMRDWVNMSGPATPFDGGDKEPF